MLPKNVECELIDEKIENRRKIEAQNVVNKAQIKSIESIVMCKNPEKLIQLELCESPNGPKNHPEGGA